MSEAKTVINFRDPALIDSVCLGVKKIFNELSEEKVRAVVKTALEKIAFRFAIKYIKRSNMGIGKLDEDKFINSVLAEFGEIAKLEDEAGTKPFFQYDRGAVVAMIRASVRLHKVAQDEADEIFWKGDGDDIPF